MGRSLAAVAGAQQASEQALQGWWLAEAGVHMIVRSMELTDTDVLYAMVIRSCRGQRVRRPWQEGQGHENEHREENAQQPHENLLTDCSHDTRCRTSL